MSDQVDQFIMQAVDHDLTYARTRVRELYTDLERIKAAAQRLMQTCDSILPGHATEEEEPF